MHSLGIIDEVKQRGGAWVFHRPVGGIGDAVMMLPAVTALKKQVGDDLVVMSCIDYIAPVFQNHPYLDYILSYDHVEIGAGIDELTLKAMSDAGSVIHRYYHPCPAAIYESEHCPRITQSRQVIFCEHAGVEFDVDNYYLELNEEEKAFSDELGGDRYVVVQIRSHDKWRDYRHMKWFLVKLVSLGRKMDFRVVTIDSTIDLEVPGTVAYTHTHLRKIFGLINGAIMLVGPDSAFIHVAGALKVPTLGLFGPTNPAVRMKYHNAHWMPWFKRCRKQYCWYMPCKWRFCLSTLKPRKILRRVKDIVMEAG